MQAVESPYSGEKLESMEERKGQDRHLKGKGKNQFAGIIRVHAMHANGDTIYKALSEARSCAVHCTLGMPSQYVSAQYLRSNKDPKTTASNRKQSDRIGSENYLAYCQVVRRCQERSVYAFPLQKCLR